MLDTGPLLTHLALHYAERIKAGIATRDAILRKIRSQMPFDESRQEAFKTLCRAAAPVLTTPHVLTEVFRLRKESELYRRQVDFRSVALELLVSGNIEEVHRPAESLYENSHYRDLVSRLRLTDTGFVSLAVEYDCVLLTDDDEMFQAYPSSPGTGFQIRMLDEYLREKS